MNFDRKRGYFRFCCTYLFLLPRHKRSFIPALILIWALASSHVFVSTASAQDPPDVVGEWSAVLDWPVVAVHAVMLPTRQVMFWAYDDDQEFHLWDPVT